MKRGVPVALFLAVLPLAAQAQNPLQRAVDAIEIRYGRGQAVIDYTVRVSASDTTGFDVTMRIRNAADTFRLAMVAHPEYDDRYWRFIVQLHAETPQGAAAVTRVDSAVWRVVAPGGAAVVHYRLQLPPPPSGQRPAWRPFLTSTGALVGGPHTFLYVVGATLAPADIALDIPPAWDVATGLEPTNDPRVFFAPTVAVLVDSPILLGQLRSWHFAVDGVPHRVAYWPLPHAVAFDTAALLSDVERITQQAIALFGRAPYRDYTFLLQDGAYGSLEHANSVTIGIPSADLASAPHEYAEEIAHEFFHSWNLVRIRPAEYGDVDYHTPPPAAGLWWSEGVTMFYADLLPRRANVPVDTPTRAAHLAEQIGSYLGNPSDSHISAERVSRAANGIPTLLGDSASASTHLQGELIGAMLDLIIRDATDGRRSLDDVMRLMMARFSGPRGFLGADIEAAATAVCGCAVHSFFEDHVRTGHPIDFNRYLALIGLRSTVTWHPRRNDAGAPAPDTRATAWAPPGLTQPVLVLWHPNSAWTRAGLHTGDSLRTVNGTAVAMAADFRAMVGRIKLGDTLRVTALRGAQKVAATVVIAGYQTPSVTIEEIPGATIRQRQLRAAWLAGTTTGESR